METTCDVIIIGAGIAGASLASELSSTHKVILLEREDQPGYHATGRSAAIFLPSYGPPAIQALTRASSDFFHAPPTGFCDVPLLSRRNTLMIAKPDDDTHIREALAAGMHEISFSSALEQIPCLNSRIYKTALIDDETSDIDVDALLHAHLKKAKRGGVQLFRQAEVSKLKKSGPDWKVSAANQTFIAPVIINAAGAWADEIAKLANLADCSLQPKRRSAALIDISDHWDVSNWPLTVGAGNTFYFRAMGRKLMISPADETTVEPHDAWPDDLALAQAMELFQEATGYEVTHLEHTWAGLRTFAPDGDPVVGFDAGAEGFFWLAGQGGYGIQTSPALSRLAAALIRKQEIPDDIVKFGVNAEQLSPNRF